MCFKTSSQPVVNTVGTPAAPGDQANLGAARKAEDQQLFGGIPNLRVDRSVNVGNDAKGQQTPSGINIQ